MFFLFMTRFDRKELILYDLKFEKTAKNLRKQTKLKRKMCQHSTIFEKNSTTIETKVETGQMDEEHTLRELAAPPINQ
ncbi:MAG: hypothetical protein Q8730_02410 [Sweet potato little leaf phytoplasma]|nr:hypothetical protein [Sweet potato little leaf phytoplasma]